MRPTNASFGRFWGEVLAMRAWWIAIVAMLAAPAGAADIRVVTAGEPIWSSDPPPAQREELILEENAKGGGFFSTSGSVDVGTGTVLDEIETNTGKRACSRDANYLAFGHTRACLIDLDGDGRFDHYSYNENGKLSVLSKPAQYSKRSRTIDVKPSFEARVIYLGASSTALNLSYREFKDSFARPAFTEDLIIPLSASYPQKVRFKGMEMEILKIDGLGMQYSINASKLMH